MCDQTNIGSTGLAKPTLNGFNLRKTIQFWYFALGIY